MLDRKKFKKFAKIQLKDRWRVPVLMTLLVTFILSLFNLPQYISDFKYIFANINLLQQQSAIEFFRNMRTESVAQTQTSVDFFLTFLQLALQFIFTISVVNVYLTMSRSPEKISFKLFFEGLNDWSRGLAAGFWFFLWFCLWGFLAIPLLTAYGFIYALMHQNLTSMPPFYISTIIMFIGFIPAFIKAISYSQLFYIAAEYQNVSVKKALKISMIITKGHKADLFVTYLTFIGWFLLGIISFGIANLWITPYYKMTMTNVYHALLKEALEKETIKPEDLE